MLQKKHGDSFKISLRIISTHIKNNINFTLKSLRKTPEGRNTRITIQKRYNYAMKIKKAKISMMNDMVFIDESGFNLHLHRKQGYVLKGHEARIIVPNSKQANLSMICAISKDGLIKNKYYLGSVTGKIFTLWIKELLTLFHSSSKKYFICDNSIVHYVKEVEYLF